MNLSSGEKETIVTALLMRRGTLKRMAEDQNRSTLTRQFAKTDLKITEDLLSKLGYEDYVFV